MDGISLLLFLLAIALHLTGWGTLMLAFAENAAEHFASGGSRSDDSWMALAAVTMVAASGGLHWFTGTWAFFAWPLSVVFLVFGGLVALSGFVLPFRIGFPLVAVAIVAGVLIPLFI